MHNKVRVKNISLFIVSALLGVLVFIAVYGVNIMNPTNDEWLVAMGGDISCPYLGWIKYRETPWRFPIGLVEGLLEPNMVCITYTDSIPLFAVFFKILDALFGLPKTFQYWGIWGAFCFAMQGGFGSFIVYEKTQSRLWGFLSSLFFILSPIVLYRMYMHTALAGQWVVLIALLLFIKKEMKFWKKAFLYTITGILAAYIHIYFIPMIVIILCGDMIRQILKKGFRMPSALGTYASFFFAPIVMTLILMWILGCFYQKGGEISDAGLGYHSFNLNGLINSTVIEQWWFGSKTRIFHGLPQLFGQYEGFAYLGAGILLLSIVTVGGSILRRKYICNKAELCSHVFIVSSCVVLALSPTVAIGGRVLFTIPWPQKIIDFLSIFRASGRLIWPVYYLIYIYVISGLYSVFNKKAAWALLIVCVGIQVYDFSNILDSVHEYYTQDYSYDTKLKSSTWNNELKKYNHVVFMGYQAYDNDIGVWATRNGIGINDFYMARKNENGIADEKKHQIENIRNNVNIDDTIYVFLEEANIWRETDSLNYYLVDGFVIGIKGTLNSDDVIPIVKNNSVKIKLNSNRFLTNGVDTENGRIIYKNGVSIGPFMHLDEGDYYAVIEGNGFENGTADIFSMEIYNLTQSSIPFELNVNSNRMTVDFSIDKPIDDFQLRVYNVGEETEIIVTDIILYKEQDTDGKNE